MRPNIIPHLLLLVFIVAEQQIGQVCTQVPCKLHDVAECRNAQGVFQHLPSELALCVLLCLCLVDTVTNILLLHKLDASCSPSRCEIVFEVTECIEQLTLVRHRGIAEHRKQHRQPRPIYLHR